MAVAPIKVTSETADILAAIPQSIQTQRDFFKSKMTLDVEFRIEQLRKLRNAIVKHEKAIFDALKEDLNKCEFEAYGTELGMVLGEIDKCIKNVKKWAKPKKVKTTMFHFKASSYIYKDPYGVVLLISPWNYPFQLLMLPLAGAIAAGNCVTLKPSELSPHTSEIMTKIIQETFSPEYISIHNGGVATSQALLKEKFDYVFFTGSTHVGKIVYQAAAKHLTPVTLELGGKSPCIIDKDINLDITAKRLMWGKLVNCGQTCIAPDYLLVHSSVKADLVKRIKEVIKEFYGENPQKSKDYGRIINERHFKRLVNLMSAGKILEGGVTDAQDRYISPTLIEGVTDEDLVMQEEIFGPILPIVEYNDINEAIKYVNDHPKPLALYIFTKNDATAQKVLNETTSGGGCVNDTLMHIGNDHLPFGGVGDSGIGAYHGEHSFDTFTHNKGVMDKSLSLDPPVRYAPYKLNLKMLKSLMKFN